MCVSSLAALFFHSVFLSRLDSDLVAGVPSTMQAARLAALLGALLQSLDVADAIVLKVQDLCSALGKTRILRASHMKASKFPS